MRIANLIPNENFSVSYVDDLSFSDIQVIGIGYEKTNAEKYPFTSKDLQHYSMHFVLSGAGYYESENNIYRLTKNCLFLLYPSTNVKYYPDKANPWKYVWINFTGGKALNILKETSLSPDFPVCSFSSQQIGRLLLQALYELETTKIAKSFTAIKYFYDIIFEITQKHPTPNIVPKKREDHISTALQYLNKNYNNPYLTLKMLSNYLHLNPSYLSRILKQQTGATFTDFLMSLRIQAAIKLMEEGNIYVNEISWKVGFNDPYYFSKVFKKHAHISPKSYINELKQRSTPPR